MAKTMRAAQTEEVSAAPSIIITGSDGSLGRALCERAEETGFDVIRMPKDVCEMPGSAREFMHIAKSKFSLATHLILNHSRNFLSFIGDEEDEENERMLRANVLTPRAILDEFAIRAPSKAECRVLFVASQTHRVAQRGTSMYCATKAAQVMMMKVAARELGPRGWVVNALAPGKIVDTRMSALTDAQVRKIRGWTQEEADAYALKLVPQGRFTDTKEVAKAALRILGMPSYIHGSVIDMTGGV